MKFLAITLFVLFFSSTTFALDKNMRFTILGYGTKSCGSYIKEYEEKSWPAIANGSWVEGYLTAINVKLKHGKNITRGTDPEARDLWLSNYCQKNPLHHLQKATDALFRELLTK